MHSHVDRISHLKTYPSGEREVSPVWSHDQLEQWRLRWSLYQKDDVAVTADRDQDQQRRMVQQELLHTLHTFLDSVISVKTFNTTFQRMTHETQNVFCLRGMSGGMFFNKLVKYVPDEDALACHLRAALALPKETGEGQRRMRALVHVLETLIAERQMKREHIQPARVPFFLSAWWHLQEATRWPIFYPLVQTTLLPEAVRLSVSHDTVDGYFVFREHALALAKTLGLSLWELEHLATWYGQRQADGLKRARRALKPHADGMVHEPHEPRSLPILSAEADEEALDGEERVSRHENDTHTHLQWLLAKIGLKVGCTVWIARNDHSKVWNNERFGDLSVSSLPLFADSVFQHIIRRIDVLWLRQDTVVAAYEIEHTTNIATGLLRLYDLGILCSHADYLCIVAPQERFRRIQFELSRPAFHTQQLHKKCGLIAEELLLEQEEHILRWAGSLSVLEALLHPSEQRQSVS